MRIPWQNNGPRILLSLSLLFPCSSITPLDGSRQTPSDLGGRKRGRNGVLASQNTLGPSKLSTFEPAYVHSDVPRVLVARIKRGLYRHMRSCEPAGGASKLYQPWRCAQYGVVLGRVRYGSHRSILSSLSPRARRSKSFFCGSGLFVFCSVLS